MASLENAVDAPKSARSLVELGTELIELHVRLSALKAELLARMEAPESRDLRRVEVPGLGKISYVSGSESDSVDLRAAARKLTDVGATLRRVRADILLIVELLQGVPGMSLREAGPAVEALVEQLRGLAEVDVDDEIPTDHATRGASLRVTPAKGRAAAAAA
jgi:hypothetical protein